MDQLRVWPQAGPKPDEDLTAPTWGTRLPGFDSVPVFRGGYLRKSNVQRNSFVPIRKRASVPKVRFHDLRHTCATLLLLADENVKGASERLGHSTVRQTLDTYSHVLPTMQKRAAEEMNSFFDQAMGRQAVL